MTVPRPAGARLDALTSWHADWSGLRVAVLGLGVTGFSVADTLRELGCTVLVVARSAPEDRADLLEVIGGRLLLADGDAAASGLADYRPELVITSPGYSPQHPLLLWAAETAVPVWGDIELAWRVRDKSGAPAEWISVTGTNGKTTTVQLVAAMVAESGRRVIACGNIGVPVLDAVREPERYDVLVVELSSYQLHWLKGVSPLASACLNVAEDHLDWHGSLESYRTTKGRVYDNTKLACVYNVEDPQTEILVQDADVVEGARAIGFGRGVPGLSQFGIVDGILCDRAFLADRQRSALELTTLEELHAAGLSAPHVVANVLAASALARAAGVEPADIRAALARFRLDAHRIEPVAESGGVRWIDDSKATNAHAADASLGAFESVVWVIGGLLKGVDLGELVEKHASRLRAAIVIGADRSAVLSAFERHAPAVPVFPVDERDTEGVMPAAAGLAAGVAQAGDVVLLAPAAASMDQFTDYAHRGRLFAEAVQQLLGGGADGRSVSPAS